MDEELQGIVQKMVEAGESEDDIALVIQNYKPSPKPEENKQGFWSTLWNTVKSGIVDQTPISIEQSGESLQSALQPANAKDYIKQRDYVGFQRYVRSKDPKYAGAAGVFTPFNEDEAIEKYASQYMVDTGKQNLVKKFEQRAPEVIARRQDLEKFVKEQKAEAEQKLKGATQDIGEVKDISSALSVAGNFIGQALYQIPVSFFTRGGSSLIMESATIYDEQLDELAKKNGITREEVIAKNLDSPALNQSYGALAASLDAVSAGSIIGAFRAKAAKGFAREAAKDILVEATTEGAQGNIERFAGKNAAGVEFDPLTKENLMATANEVIAGALGAGTFSAASGIKEFRRNKVVNDAVESVSTGSPEIDAQIDQAATPTPEELQAVKDLSISKTLQEDAVKAASIQPEIKPKENEKEGIQERGTQGTETVTESVQGEGEKRGDKIDQQKQEELQVATQKVADLQAAFTNLSIEENPAELYGKLQEAKAALLKVRVETKITTPKKETQKGIEDVTGVTKQEKISLTPSQAIKAQFDAVTKGLKRGVEIGQDKVNELVTKAREALKEFPLSTKQTQAILTKIKNTNINAYGTSKSSVSALNQFIDKVSKDAEYAEKLGIAETQKKKAKSLVSKATPKEAFALRLLTSLDPSEINVDEYNATLEEVLKPSAKAINIGKVNEFLDKATGKIYESEFGKRTTIPVQDRIYEIQQKRVKDQQQARMERLAEKTGIDHAELTDLVDSYSDEDIITANAQALSEEDAVAKREKIRRELLNTAKTIKPQLNNVPMDTLTKPQKKRLEDIKKIKPEDLNTKELNEYIKTVDRISINGDFGNAERIVAISRAIEGINKIKEKTKGGKIINLNWIESGATASLPQAIEAIYGLPDNAAIFNLYSGLNQISNSKATAEEESQKFVKMMNDLESSQKATYGNEKYGFTDVSQIRQGIYSELIRYDQAVDPDKALEKNKKAVEDSIAVYKKAGKDKDAATLETLYKPLKDLKTINEVEAKMEKIDPAGKKVTEKIIEWFKKYEAAIADYNEAVFNSPSQSIVNYAGERNWMRELPSVATSEQQDLQSVRQTPKQVQKITSAKKFTGAIPQGMVMDFNLHKKAADQVEEVVFRTKADPYRLQIREFAARYNDVLGLFGADESKPKTVEKARRLYDRVFDKNKGLVKEFEDTLLGRQYKSELQQQVSGIMSAVQKFGYNASLSGITQAPKQYSVLFSTAVNLGRNMKYLADSIGDAFSPNFNKFFEGETVNIRGVSQSLLNLGDMYKASDALAQENSLSKMVTNGLPKYAQKRFDSWWGGLKPLTKSDASAAKISFLAYYKDKLDDLGQEYKGLESETSLKESPERQEARAYAKQMVDKTQVSSNPAELARAVKDKTISSQMVKAWLLPFGSFRLNKVQRLYSDYRALAIGNSTQKKAAAKDLAGALAESVAFETIAWGLRIAIYNNLRALYRYLLDLDDEEDTELANKKSLSNAILNVATDNLPLLLVEPAKQAFMDGIKQTAYNMYLVDNEGASKQDFEEETGVSLKPRFTGSPVFDYLGAYGIAGENLLNGASMMAEGLDDDSELRDEQKSMSLFTAGLIFGNLAGVVPADVRNPALKELSVQKKAQ
jgi:hypothetical protein